MRVKLFLFLSTILFSGCLETPTQLRATSSAGSGTITRFAEGTKAVKIIPSTFSGSGSFTTPSSVPTATVVPTGYPGANGSAVYLPGVSATTYYDVDGTTVLTKPDWLIDFQLGITATSASSSCATFGGSGTKDVNGFYRVSERNCGAAANGTGLTTDPVFVLIVLDRSDKKLGASENLLIQVEYQANALRFNSDGINANPDHNVDQLWKVFWGNSLSFSSPLNMLSVFVPPNGAACEVGGTGSVAGCSGNANGAPVQTKQIIIPLAAYPDYSVIQFSRMRGRINETNGTYSYVADFCTDNDSPLCLGVIFKSIMLMRI